MASQCIESSICFSAEEVAELCESPQEFINTLLLSERPSYMSQERFESLRRAIGSLPNNINAYMTVEERRAWVVGGVAGSAAGGVIGSVGRLFSFDKAACLGQAVGAHDALTISDRGTRHVGTLRLGWSSGSSAGTVLGTGSVSSAVGYVAGGFIGVGVVGYLGVKNWWFRNFGRRELMLTESL